VPRWLKVYLALVPVFPPLYLAGFYGLKFLKGLSPIARYALFGFLALELLAALLSPRPGISFVLALLRGLFILGLIGVGIWLRDSQRLNYLLFGYVVVILTAIFTTYLAIGEKIFTVARVSHPYYSGTSIGLAGVVGIFLALLARGLSFPIRVVGISAGIFALMFSGSRGALLALGIGLISASFISRQNFWRNRVLVRSLLLSMVGIAFFQLLGKPLPFLRRVSEFTSLNGRDRLWHDALVAFKAHLWGGTGPYQLGPYLAPFAVERCRLWSGLERIGYRCPAWLEPFYGAWLIAHNTWLHALGETGIIGTLGWALLYVFATYAVIKARDALVAAIFFGFMAMGLVDNPTLVPSLSLAELFWVAVGIAIVRSGLAVPPDQLASGDKGEPRLDAA